MQMSNSDSSSYFWHALLPTQHWTSCNVKCKQTTIFSMSSSNPRNTSAIVGPTHFAGANGTPSLWYVDNMHSTLSLHVSVHGRSTVISNGPPMLLPASVVTTTMHLPLTRRFLEHIANGNRACLLDGQVPCYMHFVCSSLQVLCLCELFDWLPRPSVDSAMSTTPTQVHHWCSLLLGWRGLQLASIYLAD